MTLAPERIPTTTRVTDTTGTSVSVVIAAALRSALSRAEQGWIDQALEAQDDENVAWAEAFKDASARMWGADGSVDVRRLCR